MNKKTQKRRWKGQQPKPKKKKLEKEPVEIIVAPFGIFAFHKGKLIKKEIWKETERALKFLEYRDYLKKFKSKIPVRAKQEIKTVLNDKKLQELAKKVGVNFNFQKFMIDITKEKIKHGFSKDKLIVQAVNMLDEINKMINMFYERLSEWYGLYYPEKVEEIKSVEEFAKFVGTKRETQSMGAELEDKDLEIIKKTGEELKSLISFKEKLSSYVENLRKEILDKKSKEQIGKTMKVLIEEYKDGIVSSKSDNFYTVKAKGDENLLGKIIDIKITEYHLSSLTGEI
jgi:nucleolar protein 56